MTIAEFDHLEITEKKALLHSCCGSNTWVNNVLAALPAEDLVDLLEIAEEQWYLCHEADWKEAFTHHPKIGDIETLRKKFAATESEQEAVLGASEQTLQQLADSNQAYEQRFGYIFIVCATGKSANEMLQLLQQRSYNNPEVEIDIAMEEQLKITQLRLEKLFTT